MSTQDFGPYLSLRKAADYMDLTEKALRRRVERGTVPAWCYSRVGRSYRFMRAALDQLLAPADERGHGDQRLRRVG